MKEQKDLNVIPKAELLSRLHDVHTTELGVERIRKNLNLLQDADVVSLCKDKIKSKDSLVWRKGKNWYVSVDQCEITVNAYSLTIITAHRKKQTQ